jgi:PadR family transcriptional regulator
MLADGSAPAPGSTHRLGSQTSRYLVLQGTRPYPLLVPQIDSAVAQLRRGVLEYCVLALLGDEERYGYDLVTELSDAGLVASEGTIYPLLSRLRKEELVATSWQESPTGPPRRYYRLSSRGRTALEQFRGSWSDFKTAVDGVLEGRNP